MLTKKYYHHIASTHKSKIIVNDKDELLQNYPTIQGHLNAERYTLIFCQSLLELRIQFELNVRGEEGQYILIINQQEWPLPDILKEVYYTEVGLSDFFPNLDTDVLNGLSYKELDRLLALPNFDSKSRSESIKYILEQIYNIDYDSLIKSSSNEHWLAALLNVYSHKSTLNEAFKTFFEQRLAAIDNGTAELVNSKTDLISFLQADWGAFAKEGASKLNFDYSLLRKELNHLFITGILKPVEIPQAREAAVDYSLGIYVDRKAGIQNNISKLIEEIREELSQDFETVFQWLSFFPLVARVKYLSVELADQEFSQKVDKLEQQINTRFQDFIDRKYQSLFSLSGKSHPVTVTHILDYIRGVKHEKKALIVVDGLNLWQWELIKERGELKKYEEKTSLAWIPTITAWSRQAIFKGNAPDLSEDNRREARLFRQYWCERGIQDFQIEYYKFGNDEQSIEQIDFTKKRLGLVTNDIDNLMHGVEMGNDQFFIDTDHWIQKGYLVNMIQRLKAEDYKVWITADHGNIEATGNGNIPRKKSKFTKSKGKRHIHFDNAELKAAFLSDLEDKYKFEEINNSLYLKDTTAFAVDNKKLVTHGGSHFWEVVIPFIEI